MAIIHTVETNDAGQITIVRTVRGKRVYLWILDDALIRHGARLCAELDSAVLLGRALTQRQIVAALGLRP